MRPTGITVATLNLYLGADLAPLFAAGQSEALASRTATVWSAVEASRPAERMTAAATQLVRYLPDVVALQEAGRWQAGTTEHPRIHDLLTFFLDALAAQGTPYRVVSEGAGFSSATMSATLASATGLRRSAACPLVKPRQCSFGRIRVQASSNPTLLSTS